MMKISGGKRKEGGNDDDDDAAADDAAADNAAADDAAPFSAGTSVEGEYCTGVTTPDNDDTTTNDSGFGSEDKPRMRKLYEVASFGEKKRKKSSDSATSGYSTSGKYCHKAPPETATIGLG